MKNTRRRWLLVGLLTIGVVAATTAIGMASHESEVSEIQLVLNDEFSGFKYGTDIQEFNIAKAECDASLVGEPIMTISADTYRRSPNTTTGKVGLVEDGLGVNLRGNGNGQECGRTDYIDGVGEDIRSEMLTLSLAGAVGGRMMDWVSLDIEAKFDAVMRVEFLVGETPVGDDEILTFPLEGDRSDGGPDSGSNDKYPTGELSAGGPLFDGIRISMISGSVSLEGGATWDDPENDHYSIFHLATADASIELDNPPTDGLVIAGQVDWAYTITNTGGFPLSAVSIDVDEPGVGTGSCEINEKDPPILQPGESTICSITFTALEDGPHDLTVTVSAIWQAGQPELTASETSSYYGALGCGVGEINGDSGPLEKPYVGWVKGPDGPSPGDGCLAPILIEASNSDGEQMVTVGPVDGYPWASTTGILTIEWDVEDPGLADFPRTHQRINGVDSPIPWCEEVVDVSLYDDPTLNSLEDWYYELLDPLGLYEYATGDGDTCLISQSNRTVEYDNEVHTQTLEIFYIWNDPIFVRN